jgi:hypothetical protein
MCDFVVVRVAPEEAEEAGDPGWVAGGATACGNLLAPGDANADADPTDPEDARAALAEFPGAGSSGD